MPNLGREDVIVVNEDEREEHRVATRWNSLMTFHRAPCLWQSVGMGAVGGVGLGGLRYFGGSPSKAAFTWGSVVAGLLSATSWYTCRSALYRQAQQEISLLQRVQARDPEALMEYQRKLEARSTPPRQS